MIKTRTLMFFTLIPLILGFFVAYWQEIYSKQSVLTVFQPNNMQSTDSITLASQGNIYTLKQSSAQQITHSDSVFEPTMLGTNYLTILKSTNYSSLLLYNNSGQKMSTLLNGQKNQIDQMIWVTDPAVNPDNKIIAFVSDKDKTILNFPDNSLFVEDTTNNNIKRIKKADPYSGGIANPSWDPQQQNIIVYSYYQYDSKTLEPFSVLLLQDISQPNETVTVLTDETQNAYEASFSPNGKQLLFLGRNKDGYSVNMYIADFANQQLTNIRLIAVGDYAYPRFSNTPGNIYYLQAAGDNGYNLYTATINDNTLKNKNAITLGSHLQANSSYTVTQSSQ